MRSLTAALTRTWAPVGALAVLLFATACSSRGAEVVEPPSGAVSRSGPAQAAPVAPSGLDQQLIAAAWENDVAQARALVRRGADVNAQDGTRQSAFLIATSEGFLDLLDVTMAHGADVNAKDSFNGTGLIRAADRGHADVAGRLVRAGVDIDHVNELGWTALHEAVLLGDGTARYVDTVRVLVAAGADVHLRSEKDQVTALQHARSKGYEGIAQLLEAAARADSTVKEPADQRLSAAAASGDATAAALAIRAGADLQARDERGRTPMTLAVQERHTAVIRLLTHLGADQQQQ